MAKKSPAKARYRKPWYASGLRFSCLPECGKCCTNHEDYAYVYLEGDDLDRLAEASDSYSGSEIEQAVISALHAAYASKAELDTERIVAALEASPPLSATMAEKVQALRLWAKGRCVSAD